MIKKNYVTEINKFLKFKKLVNFYVEKFMSLSIIIFSYISVKVKDEILLILKTVECKSRET